MRWKLALVALAVIGAGVGAAAIMLIRHSGATPAAQSSNLPTSGTGGGATAPGTPLSINAAIDLPVRAGSPVPAGYQPYSVTGSAIGTAAGFKIDYPGTWSVVRVNSLRTKFQDPDASNTYVLVDLTPHTFKDMLAEAGYIKRQSLKNGTLPGYRQIGLARLKIRGYPGAYWKFTWDDNGVRQEALDLMYIADTSAGEQSYALFFTTPATQWTPMHTYFDTEAETFATVPAS